MGSILRIAFLAIALMTPVVSFAQGASVQTVKIAINPDGTAIGKWQIPFMITKTDPRVFIPEPIAFGYLSSTKYKLLSVTDLINRSIPFQQVQDEILTFNYDPTVLSYTQTYNLQYLLNPYFKKPIAIYEIWLEPQTSGYPLIDVSYPASWTLLNSYPAATSTPGHAGIEYKGYTSNSRPVILVFNTRASGVVETKGRFVISGSPDDVSRISNALNRVPNVEKLLADTVSLTMPEKVFLVVDDLSSVGSIGFEAEAVAGNPNVIVFNDKFIRSKSPEELAELIGHELVHVGMFREKLFAGSRYNSPFFNEGIAVYFQNVVHRAVFTDPQRKILNEELGRTHAIGPAEAATLYEHAFDTDFDGTGPYGVVGSYRRAGLAFARFAEVAGPAGFRQLYAGVANAQPTALLGGDDSTTILRTMTEITKLRAEQLQSPGKSENDIAGVVTRVSHGDADESAAVELVLSYIQQNVQKYFSKDTAQVPGPVATTSPIVVTPALSATTSNQVITKVLAVGSRDKEVVALQAILEAKGFLTPGSPRGYFGASTRKALVAFQKSIGLAPTGTTGPKTRAALMR